MSKMKFKVDKKGIRELLKSDGIAGECEKKAALVANTAGDGYVQEKRNYPERTGYAVFPNEIKAVIDNQNHNTLEKALRIKS